MDSFLNLLRKSFNSADLQTDKRGANQELKKDREEDVIKNLEFASDDDTSEHFFYVPFSWKKNGNVNQGYLMRGLEDGKIYGLEANNGLSMNGKGTRDFLQSLIDDGSSSFSTPNSVEGLIFLDDAKRQKSDATNYMLQKNSPFSNAVDKVLEYGPYDNVISDFVKKLRQAQNRGINYQQILDGLPDDSKRTIENAPRDNVRNTPILQNFSGRNFPRRYM